nr:hypothetical protein PFGPPNCM_00232 [Paraburkholderia sp.]
MGKLGFARRSIFPPIAWANKVPFPLSLYQLSCCTGDTLSFGTLS